MIKISDRFFFLFLISSSVALAANFSLPALPYAYDALIASIDTQTMYYHHDVHHAGYVNNLNALLGAPALADDIFLQNSGLTSLIMHIGTKKMANLSSDQQTLLRNNAGGHWNHASYWRLMAKNGSSAQPNLNSSFALAVARDFGSLTNMIAEINRSGAARFGSGWSWLVMNKTSNRLQVMSTANQDNPLMSTVLGFKDQMVPIIGVDVWEHAYYLRYGPKRTSYLSAWWVVANWQQVESNYLSSLMKWPNQWATSSIGSSNMRG